jgi:hypothetical protein
MDLGGYICDMCSWMGGQKQTYNWALLLATGEARLLQGEWERHCPLQTRSSYSAAAHFMIYIYGNSVDSYPNYPTLSSLLVISLLNDHFFSTTTYEIFH